LGTTDLDLREHSEDGWHRPGILASQMMKNDEAHGDKKWLVLLLEKEKGLL
jgi:hypothetical protein